MKNLVQKLIDAANEYDRAATEAAAERLIDRVRAKPGEELRLDKALTALRDNRWFDLLRTTGDALIEAGETGARVRKLYAQGLIDSGAIAAAIPFLQKLAGDDKNERDEARGLLGRAWKQEYVNGSYERSARKPLIEAAAASYYSAYVRKPKNYYQGINAVACLARAERDHIDVSGDFPDWREVARRILAGITADDAHGKAQYWDYASAAEACVALKKWNDALLWLKRYVKHSDTSAFAVAGTYRQFREVWRLTDTSTDGSEPLMILLEAALMKKEGGQSLDAANAGSMLQRMKASSGMLQRILGKEAYKPIGWLETGMRRSRAVGRITSANRGGAGTGFLIRACELHGSLGTEQLFVTNHHVISNEYSTAFRPGEAVVTFEGLGGKKYGVKKLLWTSPEVELDATIVRLEKEIRGVDPIPLCSAFPELDVKSRVYVIGHPLGGQLALSMTDNLLIDAKTPKLHYRAPTDPGSSGSPVFDAYWNLLALHHAGDKKFPRLRGKGRYAANEGLYFPAIAEAFLASRRRLQ
ncbi:MAG: trypsin-like serine peptidase [Thermoanaerobaculia bacterium]